MKAIRPTAPNLTAAKLEKNKTFARLIRDKDLLLRSEINKAAQHRGLWDDDKQKELESLRDRIVKGEAQLSRGGKTIKGKPFTKKAAKKLALDMMNWRGQFLALNSTLTEFDQYTVESQAENAEFDSLCSVCIVDDEDTQIFTDLNDYRMRSSEEGVEEAAAELAKLTTSYDDSWYDKLPEVAFLLKYKFVNEDYRLIDDSGQLVSDDGKLINKDGQLINEQGEPVNEFGEVVDEEGNIVDFVEFVD
jgi:hypothetical protein